MANDSKPKWVLALQEAEEWLINLPQPATKKEIESRALMARTWIEISDRYHQA